MTAKSKVKKPAARSKSRTSAKKSAAKAAKYVYLFGKKTDGNGTMKPLLGGKGANLAEMCRIGLPVPPGFTITTEVCTYYYDNNRTYPPALRALIDSGVASIEKQTGKKFGDLVNPLLVSVRSGARDSMPGMMDTILNLGLNDQTVEALARKTNNDRFAWDCYRTRTTSRSKPSSADSRRSVTTTTISRIPSLRPMTSRNSSPVSSSS